MKTTKQLFTRAEYMNNNVSHTDYYCQFITDETKNYILNGLKIDKIKFALANGDENLNKIKIPFNNMSAGGRWWWDYAPVNTFLLEELGDFESCAVRTCVAKTAARMLAQTTNFQ